MELVLQTLWLSFFILRVLEKRREWDLIGHGFGERWIWKKEKNMKILVFIFI